jgi:hypothetical protein
MTEPARVSWACSGPLSAWAMPKSATFTWPLVSTITLPGLMSRWTTPLRWANPSAEATSAPISAARRGWTAPSDRMISDRLRPSMYSITMK